MSSGKFGGSGVIAQNAMLSGKIESQGGIVEVESLIRMKIIDANGKVPLSRMAGITENLEMSLLDWKGREVACLKFCCTEYFDFDKAFQRVESEESLLDRMEVFFGSTRLRSLDCTRLLQSKRLEKQ